MTLPVLYSFRRCPYAMRARMALILTSHTCELREILLTDKPVIAYNGAITLFGDLDLIKGYSVAATQEVCERAKVSGVRCASPEFVVSKNLITLSRYRAAEQKLTSAITAILNGESYIEKIVSSENIPRAYSAA